ncbi:ribonuclease H-like domain-containing protein [Tanacetum coccineum]
MSFQRKYCLELLSEYGLLACKLAATPLQQNIMLSYEESKSNKFLSNMIEYQKVVGKLIYLSITRPDISYVVHCSSQHMHASLQSHFTAALRVLRYLKNAPGTGVQFYKGNSLSLHAFSNADWAKCPKTRKSFCYFNCWNPIFHEKTKHFKNDLHLVREKVSNGVVKVLKVASVSNVADVLTKGLGIAQHNEFCKKLRLVNMFKP